MTQGKGQGLSHGYCNQTEGTRQGQHMLSKSASLVQRNINFMFVTQVKVSRRQGMVVSVCLTLGSGTIRRYGLAGIGVALLEEVCHCVGGP